MVWGDLVSKPAANTMLMEKILYIYIFIYLLIIIIIIIIKVRELKSNPEHSAPMMAVSVALKK